MIRDISRAICLALFIAMAGGAAAQVTVPNLVGLPRTASGSDPSATASLTAAGLVLGTAKYGSSATQLVGRVYRQNPAAGTSVAAGSAVNVIIAVSTSPPLKDLTLDDVPGAEVVNGVWPWGTNPGDGTFVMSFCEMQKALIDNTTLASLIPLEYYWAFRALLALDTGDINGTSYVRQASPWPDGELEFAINGNGKLDCSIELRLIGEALKADFPAIAAHDSYTGLTHAKVLLAANRIFEQLEQDVGSYWSILGSAGNGLQQILIGHMMIGNGDASFSEYHDDEGVQKPNRIDCTGSGGFLRAAMFLLGDIVTNAQIDLANYDRMPEFFAPTGDADGDGASNNCELNYANDPMAFPTLTTTSEKTEKYVEYALNPGKRPPTEPSDYCYACFVLHFHDHSHDHWYEVGDDIQLFVDADSGGRQLSYQWEKDGIPLEDATADTYALEGLTTADSGEYRCTVDDDIKCKDGSKGSITARMVIRVVPKGSLPVAAPVALGALIGALLGGGSLALRRKRR